MKRWMGIYICCVLAGSVLPVSAGTSIGPLGHRITVYDSFAPEADPEIAMNTNGMFVVVYQSGMESITNSYGVYAQRYKSWGKPIGSRLHVNTYEAGNQSASDVDMAGDGSFVVVWESANQDGDGFGIFGQIFSSTGVKYTPEFQINAITNGQQYRPRVAMHDDGHFVVVWECDAEENWAVRGCLYDTNGSPVTRFFIIDSTAGDERMPDVAMDGDGNFVVVYDDVERIRIQRYSADATPIGTAYVVEIPADPHTLHDYPGIAMDRQGNFIVAWASANLTEGVMEYEQEIYARCFNHDGLPMHYETTAVSTPFSLKDDTKPKVAMNENGKGIITWQKEPEPAYGYDVYYRMIDHTTGQCESDTQILPDEYTYSYNPAVAMLNETYVITWEQMSAPATDSKVMAQRFGSTAKQDFNGDGYSDLGIFWRDQGNWYCASPGGSPLEQIDHFTDSHSTPVTGDYDGDGEWDIATYDDGLWQVYPSSGAFYTYEWGWDRAIPVQADYDGDSQTDIAVFDPATGDWYIEGSMGSMIQINWGWDGALPVPADYDGDGITDIAVFNLADGKWYIRESSRPNNLWVQTWGDSTCMPVPADYDGDGADDIGIYYATTGDWYILYHAGGMNTFNWGWNDALPVPGDYNADGKDEPAVYYPLRGDWFLLYDYTGKAPIYHIQNWGWEAATPLYPQYQINHCL